MLGPFPQLHGGIGELILKPRKQQAQHHTPPTLPIPPEHNKYCAICTPLGKICPNEFPSLKTGTKILKKKREKIKMKKKIKI